MQQGANNGIIMSFGSVSMHAAALQHPFDNAHSPPLAEKAGRPRPKVAVHDPTGMLTGIREKVRAWPPQETWPSG